MGLRNGFQCTVVIDIRLEVHKEIVDFHTILIVQCVADHCCSGVFVFEYFFFFFLIFGFCVGREKLSDFFKGRAMSIRSKQTNEHKILNLEYFYELKKKCN